MGGAQDENLADNSSNHRESVIQQWREVDVPVSQTILSYLDDEEEIGKKCTQGPWFKACLPGEESDDHIITAGLSQFRFQAGIVLTLLDISGSICGLSQLPNLQECSGKRYSHILEVLRTSFGCCSCPVLLIPVAYFGHWGLVVALRNDDKKGKEESIYWGDSLHYNAPTGLLHCVLNIMSSLYPSILWVIERRNFFKDVLKWEKQIDNFSCGFHMMSALCAFSSGKGSLPSTNFVRYSTDTSESLRRSCVKIFFGAFSTVSLQKSVVTDYDIICFLSGKILRPDRFPV